jgi:hypothetical protein
MRDRQPADGADRSKAVPEPRRASSRPAMVRHDVVKPDARVVRFYSWPEGEGR